MGAPDMLDNAPLSLSEKLPNSWVLFIGRNHQEKNETQMPSL